MLRASPFPGSSEASWTDVTVPLSARSLNYARDIATAIRAISRTNAANAHASKRASGLMGVASPTVTAVPARVIRAKLLRELAITMRRLQCGSRAGRGVACDKDAVGR